MFNDQLSITCAPKGRISISRICPFCDLLKIGVTEIKTVD